MFSGACVTLWSIYITKSMFLVMRLYNILQIYHVQEKVLESSLFQEQVTSLASTTMELVWHTLLSMHCCPQITTRTLTLVVNLTPTGLGKTNSSNLFAGFIIESIWASKLQQYFLFFYSWLEKRLNIRNDF